MSENTSIQMASGIESDEFETSGDYAVYDAPEDPSGDKSVKGFALRMNAAEQVGRFAEVTLSEGDDLVLEKTTSRTGRYATEGAGVRHIYISHDVLETLGGESGEEGFNAPETLGITVAASDEEAFEASRETADDADDEAESLLADAGGENEVEAEESDEEQEAADEAEALLAEAEDAA